MSSKLLSYQKFQEVSRIIKSYQDVSRGVKTNQEVSRVSKFQELYRGIKRYQHAINKDLLKKIIMMQQYK